jgi:hypothetical protein
MLDPDILPDTGEEETSGVGDGDRIEAVLVVIANSTAGFIPRPWITVIEPR